MNSVRVDVWSDVACPWCWVGKRNLEAAASDAGVELDVHWHAFELDPSAPKELHGDVSLVGRLARKYGTNEAQAQQMIDRMRSVGESVGLEFRFERVQPVSTFDAHRLLAWAADSGLQDALKDRLFRAYMNEGSRISDRDVLVEAAAQVGLDAERAGAVLSGDDFAQDVRADEAAAGQMGVSGVPFFVLDGKLGIPGAQPPAKLAELLSRVLSERTEAEPEVSGEVCGPDGCEVPS